MIEFLNQKHAFKILIHKNDPTYGKRIKQHYFMVKEMQKGKSNIISFASKKRVGANSACPCGSGKKYKRCCNL